MNFAASKEEDVTVGAAVGCRARWWG